MITKTLAVLMVAVLMVAKNNNQIIKMASLKKLILILKMLAKHRKSFSLIL